MDSKIILHVEDDSDAAFFVRRAVEKAGLACTLFQLSDGSEAVDYLCGNAPYHQEKPKPHSLPDAVILDLKLPGKDGFEVLRWIREQPHFRELPVIILTSSDRPEDLQRAKTLGMTAYLNKSVSYQNLVEFLSGIT